MGMTPEHCCAVTALKSNTEPSFCPVGLDHPSMHGAFPVGLHIGHGVEDGSSGRVDVPMHGSAFPGGVLQNRKQDTLSLRSGLGKVPLLVNTFPKPF